MVQWLVVLCYGQVRMFVTRATCAHAPAPAATQDLAAWLSEHSGAVDGLAGVARPLSSRLAELLASARPDVLDDYWCARVPGVSVARTGLCGVLCGFLCALTVTRQGVLVENTH